MSVISQNNEHAKSQPINRHVVTHQNNIIANQAKPKNANYLWEKAELKRHSAIHFVQHIEKVLRALKKFL